MPYNWKLRISDDLRSKVNIEAVAQSYIQRINIYSKENSAINYAKRKAFSEIVPMLLDMGIKNHDAAHLLHVSSIALNPQLYEGCGCCDPRTLQSYYEKMDG